MECISIKAISALASALMAIRFTVYVIAYIRHMNRKWIRDMDMNDLFNIFIIVTKLFVTYVFTIKGYELLKK